MDELTKLEPVARDEIAVSMSNCREIVMAIESMLTDESVDVDGLQNRLNEIAEEAVNLHFCIQEFGIAETD